MQSRIDTAFKTLSTVNVPDAVGRVTAKLSGISASSAEERKRILDKLIRGLCSGNHRQCMNYMVTLQQLHCTGDRHTEFSAGNIVETADAIIQPLVSRKSTDVFVLSCAGYICVVMVLLMASPESAGVALDALQQNFTRKFGRPNKPTLLTLLSVCLAKAAACAPERALSIAKDLLSQEVQGSHMLAHGNLVNAHFLNLLLTCLTLPGPLPPLQYKGPFSFPLFSDADVAARSYSDTVTDQVITALLSSRLSARDLLGATMHPVWQSFFAYLRTVVQTYGQDGVALYAHLLTRLFEKLRLSDALFSSVVQLLLSQPPQQTKEGSASLQDSLDSHIVVVLFARVNIADALAPYQRARGRDQHFEDAKKLSESVSQWLSAQPARADLVLAEWMKSKDISLSSLNTDVGRTALRCIQEPTVGLVLKHLCEVFRNLLTAPESDADTIETTATIRGVPIHKTIATNVVSVVSSITTVLRAHASAIQDPALAASCASPVLQLLSFSYYPLKGYELCMSSTTIDVLLDFETADSVRGSVLSALASFCAVAKGPSVRDSHVVLFLRQITEGIASSFSDEGYKSYALTKHRVTLVTTLYLPTLIKLFTAGNTLMGNVEHASSQLDGIASAYADLGKTADTEKLAGFEPLTILCDAMHDLAHHISAFLILCSAIVLLAYSDDRVLMATPTLNAIYASMAVIYESMDTTSLSKLRGAMTLNAKALKAQLSKGKLYALFSALPGDNEPDYAQIQVSMIQTMVQILSTQPVFSRTACETSAKLIAECLTDEAFNELIKSLQVSNTVDDDLSEEEASAASDAGSAHSSCSEESSAEGEGADSSGDSEGDDEDEDEASASAGQADARTPEQSVGQSDADYNRVLAASFRAYRDMHNETKDCFLRISKMVDLVSIILSLAPERPSNWLILQQLFVLIGDPLSTTVDSKGNAHQLVQKSQSNSEAIAGAMAKACTLAQSFATNKQAKASLKIADAFELSSETRAPVLVIEPMLESLLAIIVRQNQRSGAKKAAEDMLLFVVSTLDHRQSEDFVDIADAASTAFGSAIDSVIEHCMTFCSELETKLVHDLITAYFVDKALNVSATVLKRLAVLSPTKTFSFLGDEIARAEWHNLYLAVEVLGNVVECVQEAVNVRLPLLTEGDKDAIVQSVFAVLEFLNFRRPLSNTDAERVKSMLAKVRRLGTFSNSPLGLSRHRRDSLDKLLRSLMQSATTHNPTLVSFYTLTHRTLMGKVPVSSDPGKEAVSDTGKLKR